MKAKLIDSELNVLEYDVAMFHLDSERGEIALQLREPKIHSQPSKKVYRIELFDDAENAVDTIPSALYKNYHVTIDEASVSGESVPMRFVNNSFGFVLL